MPAAAKSTRSPRKSKARLRVRDELVTSHMRLVRHALDRIAQNLPRHVDREDLLEAGMVGLIDAAERFDPDREVQFSTYATTRIRGAIFDALRAADWLPRSLRSEIDALNSARNELEHRYHRPASDNDLTARLGMTQRKVTKLTRASRSCVFQSLDALHEATNGGSFDPTYPSRDTAETPDEIAVLSEDKERLADAIGELPENERLVISLYYFEQVLLREIGKVLHVSDSRVCQIHRSALKRLEQMMSEPETATAELACA